MNKIKYIKAEEAVIRGEGSDYKITNFITKSDNPNISIALSVLDGAAPQSLNIVSDRYYYFIEADATFTFDSEIINVESDSVLFIPKDTKYKMHGQFRAVLINTPPFDIVNEKHFE